MASTVYTTYTWQQGDTLRRVAGRQLVASGYTSAYDLAEDIRTANLPGNVPTTVGGIIDWTQGPAIGAVIIIPHLAS